MFKVPYIILAGVLLGFGLSGAAIVLDKKRNRAAPVRISSPRVPEKNLH
jgi:hypothetical protein